MKKIYLIRLDDACPYMDTEKWLRIEKILDQYGVQPMVGIIPDNKDPQTIKSSYNDSFWNVAKNWESKGWAIALHGFNHTFDSKGGMNGLNPMWERSEFAGVPLDKQRDKVLKGVAILREHNINPNYFFAPAHTYDSNTIEALKAESDIKIISDTIATKPYKMNGFSIIPQLGGHCVKMKIPGVWTFCFHPNNMENKDFVALEEFLKVHQKKFISFDDLDLTNLKGKSLLGKLLSWAYFTSRKIRRMR